jgi:hypothetical protein
MELAGVLPSLANPGMVAGERRASKPTCCNAIDFAV